MKKNMLSIIILALLIVNIALTAVMMFSVVPSANKTNKLVGDIASILSLELSSPDAEDELVEEVSIDDRKTYDIEAQMTVGLKKGDDGKDHVAVFSVSLVMNSKDKDYKKYGEKLEEQESLIKDAINSAVTELTVDEARDIQVMQDAILKNIQAVFGGSKFIYKVAVRDVMVQ